MVEQTIAMLLNVLTAVSGWFVDIFTRTQTTGIYLSAMFVVFSFGYLLAPVLRSSGSDRAVKKKDGE